MPAAKNAYYALSNPLSMLLDKPAQGFQRKDLLRVIAEKGIERITFHYAGLDSKLKELKIPVVSPLQAETILAEGERVDGSSIFKGMVDMGLSDLYVVPVYRTAFLNPFDDKSLDFICRYFTKDGILAPFAPDNILANAASLLEKTAGLELRALGELEFYVLFEKGKSLYPARRQRGYHASSPFVKSGPILNEMLHHIAQLTGAVKYAHSEVGFIDSVQSDVEELKDKRAEQMEIELLPRPVADMADDVVLARWLIRNIAYRHGLTATFTPKLEEGVAGSGMHFHLELRRDGRNILVGPDGRLSTEARRLIGGLCEYADSLTAFGNTVASAYLRLVPNQEAPTRICWSDLNRSALIRVPLGWANLPNLAHILNPQENEAFRPGDSRQTVELRSPDGSASIHLLLAGMAMAAEWGFRDEPSVLFPGALPLELAERLYVQGNIFADPELLMRLPSLPPSCVASGRLLLEKRGLYEREGIFPPSVIGYMAKQLQAEDDEFLNAKILARPADDRQNEIHRIMHKDIHKH
jgi:glutamine synthetase